MNFSEAMFYENYLTSDFHANTVISKRVCLPIKMASKTVTINALYDVCQKYVPNPLCISSIKTASLEKSKLEISLQSTFCPTLLQKNNQQTKLSIISLAVTYSFVKSSIKINKLGTIPFRHHKHVFEIRISQPTSLKAIIVMVAQTLIRGGGGVAFTETGVDS